MRVNRLLVWSTNSMSVPVFINFTRILLHFWRQSIIMRIDIATDDITRYSFCSRFEWTKNSYRHKIRNSLQRCSTSGAFCQFYCTRSLQTSEC